MNPYTYTPGPTFKLNGPVTAVQVANVIDDLNYLMPGCNFAPEAICEGGISWPVQRQGPYKTFRFDSCMGDWPWLSHPDLNGSLRECDDQVVFDDFRSKSFDTFLKAFHGAPCYCRVVRCCFNCLYSQVSSSPNLNGSIFVCKRTKWPSATQI